MAHLGIALGFFVFAFTSVFATSVLAEDAITRERIGVPASPLPSRAAVKSSTPALKKPTASTVKTRAAQVNRGVVAPSLANDLPPPPPPPARPQVQKPRSTVWTEEAVNLDAPSVNAPTSTATSEAKMGAGGGHGEVVHPGFKFYFDFLYAIRPDVVQPGFDSFHQVMMAEITASPEFTFMTEISTAPRFFEADYTFSPLVTLRWGKIWIPFDDMAPHNIFGGRINTSKFFENANNQPFLPDLWADLGVALKSKLVDTTALELESQLYVVNGFKGAGVDPTGEKADYPDFSNPQISADNNSDKAFGARLHADIAKRLGLGGSFYSGRYTAETAESQRVTMYGADVQLRPTSTLEFRGGAVLMDVGLNPPAVKTSFKRGGEYVEGGFRFGYQNRFKFLLRGGMAQNDSRVIDVTDKKLVGGTFLYLVGPIQLSVEYNKDLQKVTGKKGYNFAALRVVTAF